MTVSDNFNATLERIEAIEGELASIRDAASVYTAMMELLNRRVDELKAELQAIYEAEGASKH